MNSLLALLGIGGTELLVIVTILFLVPACFGLWIWMLVDCLNKETDPQQRLTWTLVIALVGPIGAAIYGLLRKSRRGKRLPAELL